MIERFILSLKNECTRVIFVSPHRDAFRQELTLFSQWYNQGRSHSGRKHLPIVALRRAA